MCDGEGICRVEGRGKKVTRLKGEMREMGKSSIGVGL